MTFWGVFKRRQKPDLLIGCWVLLGDHIRRCCQDLLRLLRDMSVCLCRWSRALSSHRLRPKRHRLPGLSSGQGHFGIHAGSSLVVCHEHNVYISTVLCAPAQIAGNASSVCGYDTFSDGSPATRTKLNGPWTAIAAGGGAVYIADSGNCLVRFVSSGGSISTVSAVGNQIFAFGYQALLLRQK